MPVIKLDLSNLSGQTRWKLVLREINCSWFLQLSRGVIFQAENKMMDVRGRQPGTVCVTGQAGL